MRLTQKQVVPAWLGSIAVSASILLLFSGLVQYRFNSGASEFAPTAFILPMVGLGCAASAFGGLFGDRMGRAMLVWGFLYMSISSVGAVFSPDPGAAAIILRQRLLAVGFFLSIRALCGTPEACRWGIRAVIGVQLISIGTNIYEWFSPLAFSTTYGRAAGLYVNPNIAGEALLCGMILGALALASVPRGLFLAASGLAVMLTVSRGAVIGGAAALFWLLRDRGTRRMWMMVGAMTLVAVVWIAGQMTWATSDVSDTQRELFDRMTISGSQDLNTESRLDLAEAGLRMFLANPIAGDGLGAMERINGAGTHNMLVMHLAEHGLLGVLIYPGFIALLAARARSMREHPEFMALAVFLAVWSFFSHNVLDEFEPLAVAAIALAPIHALRQAVAGSVTIPATSVSSLPVLPLTDPIRTQ